MNILEKIIENKKWEIVRHKEIRSEQLLQGYPDYSRKCCSLKDALCKPGSTGIIAEFKQKSPSKGEINQNARAEVVTRDYVNGGAAGLSILTDFPFFGGTLENLAIARKVNPETPILRKDFIIDSYQITEAKAFGADVILLIASCLEKQQAEELAEMAKSLGMEVLLEVHHAEELEILNDFVDLVGVNNRNLKTFEVDLDTSVKLAEIIPERFVKISESGLSGADAIHHLRESGYKGFLIGETFMKTENPGETLKTFISKL